MIVRVRRRAERPFVVLETATLRLRALSLKARGLWAMCMSYPDDWEFTRSHLERQSERDGREAVQGALQELAAAHLASLEVVRSSDGRMRGSRWSIYEVPELCPSYTGERVSRPSVTGERVFRQPVTGERVFRQPGNPHLRSKEVVRSKEERSKDALRKKQQQQRARAPARGGEGLVGDGGSGGTAGATPAAGQAAGMGLPAALPAAAFSIEEERAGDAAAFLRAGSGQLSAVSLKTASGKADLEAQDLVAAWSSEGLPLGDALPADRLPADKLPAAAAFSKEGDQGGAHLVAALVERGVDEAVARRLVDEGEAEHVRAMLARGAKEANEPGWYVAAIRRGYRARSARAPSLETYAEAVANYDRLTGGGSPERPFTLYYEVVSQEDGTALFRRRGGET